MKNGDLPAMPSGVLQDGHNCGEYPLHTGLTKREMFAMAAMQGMCSDVKTMFEITPVGEIAGDYMARQAIVVADALLAELEKSK